MLLSRFIRHSAQACSNPSTTRSWCMNWAGEVSAHYNSSRYKVIVEIKSVDLVVPVHKKQLLTYLRLADKRLELLINFNVALIKDGITRIVNGLEEDSHATPPSRKDP